VDFNNSAVWSVIGSYRLARTTGPQGSTTWCALFLPRCM